MFNKHGWGQFLCFCTVGLGNTAIDLFCFFILTLSGVPYFIAQIMAYSSGMLNSYICNRKWTFHMGLASDWAEIFRFLMVNLLSLGFSSLLMFACNDLSHQALWVSKIIATGGAVLLNYVGSHLWVFQHSETRAIHQ